MLQQWTLLLYSTGIKYGGVSTVVVVKREPLFCLCHRFNKKFRNIENSLKKAIYCNIPRRIPPHFAQNFLLISKSSWSWLNVVLKEKGCDKSCNISPIVIFAARLPSKATLTYIYFIIFEEKKKFKIMLRTRLIRLREPF